MAPPCESTDPPLRLWSAVAIPRLREPLPLWWAGAKAAGAKRLVLTHISDELGDDWALEQAREIFEGPLEVAREGATYEV